MQRALELAMERARADRRGRGGGRAPASRGCSTSSRRRCRPSAKCSKPTRCRTARPRPGCRCSNCCAAISALRTPTMRPRAARKSEPRWRRSTRHCKTRCRTCSGCSASVEGPDPLAQMDPQIKRRRTLDAIKRIILRESPEATASRDLRGPALDRRADPGAARPARRQHRQCARAAAGQLSSRVPP